MKWLKDLIYDNMWVNLYACGIVCVLACVCACECVIYQQKNYFWPLSNCFP